MQNKLQSKNVYGKAAYWVYKDYIKFIRNWNNKKFLTKLKLSKHTRAWQFNPWHPPPTWYNHFMLTIILGFTTLLFGIVTVLYAVDEFKENKKLQKNESNWADRPILDEIAFKKLYRHLENDNKGWRCAEYADALVSSVIKNGFRYSCQQVHDLYKLYDSLYEINTQHVNSLTFYKMCTLPDAQDKFLEIISAEEPKTLHD